MEAACDDDADLTGELDGVAQGVLEPAVNTRHDEEPEEEGVAAADGGDMDDGPGGWNGRRMPSGDGRCGFPCCGWSGT